MIGGLAPYRYTVSILATLPRFFPDRICSHIILDLSCDKHHTVLIVAGTMDAADQISQLRILSWFAVMAQADLNRQHATVKFHEIQIGCCGNLIVNQLRHRPQDFHGIRDSRLNQREVASHGAVLSHEHRHHAVSIQSAAPLSFTSIHRTLGRWSAVPEIDGTFHTPLSLGAIFCQKNHGRKPAVLLTRLPIVHERTHQVGGEAC